MVTGIDNNDAECINRQIARLGPAYPLERYDNYWETADAPNQLPALPMETAI